MFWILLLLMLLRPSLTCLLRFLTSSSSASGGWEYSAICAVMVRMFLFYSLFFGRFRELRVVCGIMLAVCCMLLIACCSVVVVRIIVMARFLKTMAPASFLGIHPFVVVVVECCLLVLVVSSSSSMYKITGWWSDLSSSVLPVNFMT